MRKKKIKACDINRRPQGQANEKGSDDPQSQRGEKPPVLRRRQKKNTEEGGKRKTASNSLIADLLDLEQPTPGTDVRLAQVLNAVDDGRANGQRDTVVV
jgi:hypothetical protein